MFFEEFTKEQIIELLVDNVHSMILYPQHKNYINNLILNQQNNLQPQLLAARLDISLGEVLVILEELKEKK
jgi:hypothetical protein